MKVKTKAVTIQGVLEAIIGTHFVVEDLGSVRLHFRDAVKCILANFEVAPKPSNEFKLPTHIKASTRRVQELETQDRWHPWLP